MRASSGVQTAAAGRGAVVEAVDATRSDAGRVGVAPGLGAAFATRAAALFCAAATEAGVGWRRFGVTASVAEIVAAGRAPRPTAMSGTRKAGSGRSGTTETRACTAARRAGRAAPAGAGPALATLVLRAPTAADDGLARCAASQRARKVVPMPRMASVGSESDGPPPHSAGAQRRT